MVRRLFAAIKAETARSVSWHAAGRLLPSDKSLLLSLQNLYETLAISAPTVVDALRGTVTREACNDRLEAWSSHVIRNAEIMVTVHGRERLTSGRTFVLMSNHQSHYDVPVLYYVVGPNMRMVANKELFDLPVLGRAMREAGFIEVDRANRNQAIASLKDATRHLSEGVHLWVAPEGTRSETGELLPFKKGGFVIAMDMKAPIIPVTIRGTREVLRAHGLRSRRGAAVDVTLHPPVETAPYAERTDRKAARGEVMDAVRGAIASAL